MREFKIGDRVRVKVLIHQRALPQGTITTVVDVGDFGQQNNQWCQLLGGGRIWFAPDWIEHVPNALQKLKERYAKV